MADNEINLAGPYAEHNTKLSYKTYPQNDFVQVGMIVSFPDPLFHSAGCIYITSEWKGTCIIQYME